MSLFRWVNIAYVSKSNVHPFLKTWFSNWMNEVLAKMYWW
jgi:hypothetical protein